MNKVKSWDETFIEMAKVIAKRSKDPNTQVGAVIVDARNKIIGVGYNGMPQGDDSFPWSSPEKYDFVIHAEENAILNSRSISGLDGCIVYCTHFPCVKCSRILAQVGISKIFYIFNGSHRCEKSEEVLSKCGIEAIRINN